MLAINFDQYSDIESLDIEGKEIWRNLPIQDKAIVLNYKRQLLSNLKIERSLIFEINDIHRKYPEFSMWCVP
jgi:hypothetical protein